jgi:hypothetical protein
MYKIEKSTEHTLTTLLFDLKKEPHVVEVDVLESLIDQISTVSTRTGGGDRYVITKNTMLFELLITRGLVEFSHQVNCIPYSGEIFYFVKDGKIVRSELIV